MSTRKGDPNPQDNLVQYSKDVIPAKVGIKENMALRKASSRAAGPGPPWIPACAGMTVRKAGMTVRKAGMKGRKRG